MILGLFYAQVNAFTSASNEEKLLNLASVASQKSDIKQMKKLLDKGTNIEAQAAHQDTPLLHAIENGRLPAVQFLLRRNAKVNYTYGAHSQSPLQRAVAKSIEFNNDSPKYKIFKRIITLLLDNGADPDLEDNQGRTARSLANSQGSAAIKRLIHDAVPTHQAQPKTAPIPSLQNEEELLNLASVADSQADINRIKLLIKQGINIEAQAAHGDTPLLHAIENGKLSVVKLLLEHSAKVNYTNGSHYQSPLQRAVAKAIEYSDDESKRVNFTKIVELLLKVNADPNLTDNHGRSARSLTQRPNVREELKNLLEVN